MHTFADHCYKNVLSVQKEHFDKPVKSSQQFPERCSCSVKDPAHFEQTDHHILLRNRFSKKLKLTCQKYITQVTN